MQRPNPIATKRRALGDITNNYVEESKDAGVKKTSHQAFAPMVDIPRTMETVEEFVAQVDDRIYMQRPSDEIDARDAGNPILATTYVEQMYAGFMTQEKKCMVNSSYMSNQPYVNERMRAILVDWLVS